MAPAKRVPTPPLDLPEPPENEPLFDLPPPAEEDRTYSDVDKPRRSVHISYSSLGNQPAHTMGRTLLIAIPMLFIGLSLGFAGGFFSTLFMISSPSANVTFNDYLPEPANCRMMHPGQTHCVTVPFRNATVRTALANLLGDPSLLAEMEFIGDGDFAYSRLETIRLERGTKMHPTHFLTFKAQAPQCAYQEPLEWVWHQFAHALASASS